MPLSWIESRPRPDEREPDERDKREVDWLSQLDIELRAAQRAAYEACRDYDAERLERAIERDIRSRLGLDSDYDLSRL